MPNRRALIAVALLLANAGCDLLPKKTPETVPIADVINKVKDEVLVFYQSPVEVARTAPPGAVCMGADGKNTVKLQAKTVKLTLKTVATTANDVTAGLKAPLGVLSVDPSYAGSYSKSNAQSMEFGLGHRADKVPPVKEIDLKVHPLYAAARSMAQGLVDADHTKLPCLTPDTIKVTLNFDVVGKSTGGAGIQLVIFKLGDKVTLTDEFHQTLELTFDHDGSSAQFLPDQK